jgi:hypothetical protein
MADDETRSSALRLNEFEAAVGVEAVTVASPDDGISEEACQPEAEACDVFERQERPVHPRVEHLG